MRTINILSFIIYPIMICFLLFIPLLGYFSFELLSNLQTRIPTYILFGTKYETFEFAFPIYISTFLYFASYVFIIITFYFFNKVIEQFKKKLVFDSKTIYYFKVMGYLLCVSFIIKFTTMLFINYKDDLFIKDNLIGVNNLFEMPIVILIFGLFFIILSKAFEIGKKQKEENLELKQESELTI